MVSEEMSMGREVADRLVYLASPYSHPEAGVREARFQAACRATAELMRAGHFAFSPIAHTHPVALAGDLPKGWDFWQAYDHRMIEACDEVAVLQIEGWRESAGVAAEIAYAESIGKPVRYLESDNREAFERDRLAEDRDVAGPVINARDERDADAEEAQLEPPFAQVIDLMAALKESLAAGRKP